MNFKSSILAATLVFASAFASANTSINLIASTDTPGEYSGAFEGIGAVNTFDLDLTKFKDAGQFYASVSANFTGGSGYDVTSVYFDGIKKFDATTDTPSGKKNGSDFWELNLDSLTSSVHTITVNGKPLANTKGFVGSLSLNLVPVPEPETYAMMIAGLGLVGFMARRRKA